MISFPKIAFPKISLPALPFSLPQLPFLKKAEQTPAKDSPVDALPADV